MHELFENFGIDWKLLIAQAVNFFILFLILKKFAYAPIIKMLEERRTRIKKGLEDSAESERRLSKAKELEEDIVSGAQDKAVGIVSQAENIAFKKEADIIENAHKKADSVVASAQKVIDLAREKQAEEVREEAKDLVLLATARVLGKMEPDRRDEILVREALEELKMVAKKI